MGSLAAHTWGAALLPEYVFLEVVTVLAARRDHEETSRAGDVLLRNREIEFVPCSEIFLAAFDCFRRHRGLSFADAANVAIARQCSAAILTFHADFERMEGLEVLP